MALKSPNEYTPKYFSELRTYLNQANAKLGGDNSFDSPSSGLYKDDDTNPIDDLNVKLYRIIDALNVQLTNPKQQKIQLKMYKDYTALLETTKHSIQGRILTEKLETGLKSIETNSLYIRNNTNLNDLVK